jgi:hypothetical protein
MSMTIDDNDGDKLSIVPPERCSALNMNTMDPFVQTDLKGIEMEYISIVGVVALKGHDIEKYDIVGKVVRFVLSNTYTHTTRCLQTNN